MPRRTAAYPDDDRPLTEAGIAKMNKEAKGLLRLIAPPDLVLTSPLRRAAETADIVARAFSIERRVDVCAELLPGASMNRLIQHLAGIGKASSILLVGHQPDLGHLAAYLLGSAAPLVEFKKGSLACIRTGALAPKAEGRLLWLLTPRQIRALA
ncbi:MAG: phosphohistidine phosphatase SixA [Acidobacteria bacterium]|nr:phosphohistidine phosphatase SixA [Acidobacteriota bacterium]